MSKRLVLVIDNCKGCLVRVDGDTAKRMNIDVTDFNSYYCSLSERKISDEDDNDPFPHWCPLEDHDK